MLFISLTKFKAKPTIEVTNGWHKKVDPVLKKQNIKMVAAFWTLGKYDAVLVFDAPSEAALLKFLYDSSDFIDTETMSAVTESSAEKFLG